MRTREHAGALGATALQQLESIRLSPDFMSRLTLYKAERNKLLRELRKGKHGPVEIPIKEQQQLLEKYRLVGALSAERQEKKTHTSGKP